MKAFLSFVLAVVMLNASAQRLSIVTLNKQRIVATILTDSGRKAVLNTFNGKRDRTLDKKSTARTYILSNGSVLIEFFDREAVLFKNRDDFKKLERVQFTKNSVDFLKKNISYKIELPQQEANQILRSEAPKQLSYLKSDMPQYYDFKVYQLATGQILYIESTPMKTATIYADLKTLCSDSPTITEEVYGSQDDEYLMKKMAAGDALSDYESTSQLVYPKYLQDLIKNHKLTLVERKVYVSQFFGNLYKSKNGYYILIDEVNQKNGAGDKMPILDLRFYESLQQVRKEQKAYEETKDMPGTSQHFYQKISDKYGEHFARFAHQLTDSLPALLNFDKERLSFDSAGIDLVDEAFKWNMTADASQSFFDTAFPSVLAYYGECYIKNKKGSKWTAYFDEKNKVWVPLVARADGKDAWDWIHFYKDLAEGPIPLRWAGNWDER